MVIVSSTTTWWIWHDKGWLQNQGNRCQWNWLDYQHDHGNGDVFILTKFSSLAALKVVKMTTFSAASGENFVKMKTYPFQWWQYIGVSLQHGQFTYKRHPTACLPGCYRGVFHLSIHPYPFYYKIKVCCDFYLGSSLHFIPCYMTRVSHRAM